MHEYITLTQAAKLVPGRKPGKGVSEETVWRWCLRGVRNGIRLKSEMVGGHRCTTRQWLQEFIEALNEKQSGTTSPQPRTPEQRRRASEQAAEELRKRWNRSDPVPGEEVSGAST